MPDASVSGPTVSAYRPPDDAVALERHRACLGAVPAILFELSLETGALRWVSENVAALTGHPASAVVGERARWLQLVHAADRPALEGAMRAARRQGRYDVEFRLRHASGDARWFRSAGTVDACDAAGDGARLVRGHALVHEEHRRLALRERTYRELTLGASRAAAGEEVLVHVVEAARHLLDANRAKIYVVDGDGRVLRNAAQSGAVAVPVIAIPVDAADSVIARCFRQGRVERIADYGEIDTPYAARMRANQTGPLVAVPVRVGDAPAGVLVVTRASGAPAFVPADVEDAQHLAAQASFAIAMARRDDAAGGDGAARSAYLSILGHELRTPLNTIEGFLELLALETPGPLNERQRDYLARVRRASTHVVRLVDDLFDLSRAELGRARLALARFDAREPLAHAAELVRPRADLARLSLDVAALPGPVAAYGDADRVRQILVNLLVNAVKFTATGGITAWLDRDDDGHVRFHVRDTGVGIAPDVAARIFEPFFQARAAEHRLVDDPAGAGLGLAVSRSLARAMGGELSVASGDGLGSTFTLVLPAAPPPVISATPPAPAGPGLV